MIKEASLKKVTLFGGLLLVGLLVPLIIKNPYWVHVFVMAYFYGLLGYRCPLGCSSAFWLLGA
jgi:hypothetical protein